MNDCVNGDIRDVLPELVNGTLPAAETARVQAHVRQCADCAAEVELIRTARAAMRLAPTMDTMRIASAVQASTAQRLTARRVPARVARLAGVSLIVALGAVGLWATSESSLEEPDRQVAAVPPAASEPNVVEAPDASIESSVARAPASRTASSGARAPALLALGYDIGQLEDEQLLALLEEVSGLEAIPGEEPSSLAIEPLMPTEPGDPR